jgi:hypothetical protein
MSSLTVSYDLRPPEGTHAPALDPRTTHSFAVARTEGAAGAHYDALRAAVAQAKETLGTELTAWRDAVGKRELAKEAAPAKAAADDDDEEDGEDADEA